ncbi:type VI secretion system-associated protein TagF [Paracidovorax sp. MALMAid1276]|uniref:type VI secretion system-associated protein TagF n=1 Tax=Paracidovorax sp. MALMAid1276 TaxID=3411631 RepID=UPI003B9CDEAA
MPEQPLSPAPRHGEPLGAAGWYGKLPGLGDFAGRRMSHTLESEWDTWLRAGMDELRALNAEGWTSAFVTAPVWFFVASATATRSALVGALAPSMDRVGRYYPLTILAAPPLPGSGLADDPRLRAFFSGARAAIVDARRQTLSAQALDERVSHLAPPFDPLGAAPREPSLIDDILSDLSEASTERHGPDATVELPRGEWREWLRRIGAHSVWWVSPTAHARYRDVVHHGSLDRTLFCQLFSTPAYADPNPAPTTS